MRWILAYWAQLAIPRTNENQAAIPNQEDYAEYDDSENEWFRRLNSIAMVNENFVESGIMILQGPRTMNSPGRFPDENDPEMPALMALEDDEPPITQSDYIRFFI